MQEQKYELTSPQKSIWVTEQYYKDTAVNTICGTAIIHDKINFELLKKSMQIVIKNNDVLKIRFGLSDGRIHTYKEIAKEFKINVSRVKTLEARALKKLKHPSVTNDYIDKLKIIAYSEYFNGEEEILIAFYDGNKIEQNVNNYKYDKELIIPKLEAHSGVELIMKLENIPKQEFYSAAHDYKFKILIE